MPAKQNMVWFLPVLLLNNLWAMANIQKLLLKLTMFYRTTSSTLQIDQQEPEHSIKMWAWTRKSKLIFCANGRKVYCCDKARHKSPQCWFKDKPKPEWATNISQHSYAQASNTKPKLPNLCQQSNYKQTIQTQRKGWAGLHHQLYQQENMKKWILLDNESTVTVFCNPGMVKNI